MASQCLLRVLHLRADQTFASVPSEIEISTSVVSLKSVKCLQNDCSGFGKAARNALINKLTNSSTLSHIAYFVVPSIYLLLDLIEALSISLNTIHSKRYFYLNKLKLNEDTKAPMPWVCNCYAFAL